MSEPARHVTDHAHVWKMNGRWRGPRCARCDLPVSSHLSYGADLAEMLGGDPLDYVRPLAG